MRKVNKPMARRAAQILFAAVLPALAFVSCADTYPEIISNDGSYIGNDETYDKVPIMLFVNEPSYFSISATRGSGPFYEGNNLKYESSWFHVFAFRDGTDLQGVFSQPADMTATIHPGGQHDPDADNASCLLDGPDYNFGLPTKLDPDRQGELDLYSTGALVTNEKYYFSAKYQDVGYNFFGYHLDNLDQPSGNCVPHRTSDRIWYELTLDGSQDILVGHAPKLTAAVLEEKNQQGNLGLTQADKERIVAIGNYSTYAAHRAVYPVMELSHCLSQFKFEVSPGDETADKIKITKVAIEGKNSGELTVAAHDLSRLGFAPRGSVGEMLLHEEIQKVGEDSIAPVLDGDKYSFRYNPSLGDWRNQERVELGDCVMVPVDSAYTLKIYFTQTLDNGQTKDVITRYRLRAGTDRNYYEYNSAERKYYFRPGYSYTVSVAIYGLQPIVMRIDITGWKDGGSIDIDPDNPDQETGSGHLGDEVVVE